MVQLRQLSKFGDSPLIERSERSIPGPGNKRPHKLIISWFHLLYTNWNENVFSQSDKIYSPSRVINAKAHLLVMLLFVRLIRHIRFNAAIKFASKVAHNGQFSRIHHHISTLSIAMLALDAENNLLKNRYILLT